MSRPSVRVPTTRDLAPTLRAAAERIATVLRAAGHEAWLVGGAVRDLALGRSPVEIDLATDALPDRVEALFARTFAVGKAFGTIVVHLPEVAGAPSVEVTTFRADGAYSDGRRPEQVTYGSSAQEDARRRDFTCNALYLDPLDGTFLDPARGLADLEAGRLRCVGEASERFAEDGLRLLRLARFAARFDLAVEPATLAAARASADALRGVSPERVLAELTGLFATARPAPALRLLVEADLLDAALARPGDALREARLAAAAALVGPWAPATGLALVLDSAPLGAPQDGRAEAAGLLERLHPSRALRAEVVALWRSTDEARELVATAATRARRVRALRRPSWPEAARLGAAWLGALGAPGGAALAALEAERARLTAAELAPAPLLASRDLAAAGVPRGPRWSALLEEAETLQLDGALRDRDAALAWLARRAAEPA